MYDKTDRRIIAALRKRSDENIRTYSKQTGVARSTLHARLHKLCNAGLRFAPIIDFKKIGHPISMLFITPYKDGLWEDPCVNTCQHISPDTLLLECVFADMKEAEEFKKRMHLARFFTVVDVLKREGFIPPQSEE